MWYLSFVYIDIEAPTIVRQVWLQHKEGYQNAKVFRESQNTILDRYFWKRIFKMFFYLIFNFFYFILTPVLVRLPRLSNNVCS